MLELDSLKKSYGDLEVLDSISLTVRQGETVGIVGPSGCGKTTLLNIIAGLDTAYQGTISNRFSKTGFVFQEDRLLPWRTLSENIRLVNDSLTDEALNHLLTAVELDDFSSAMPDELSGGMRQRVSIARAFAFGADLLLMDEPFKSLDLKLKESLMEVLLALHEETGAALLLVTHDYYEAAVLCDRIILLTDRPAKTAGMLDNPGDKRARIKDRELTACKMREIAEILQK